MFLFMFVVGALVGSSLTFMILNILYKDLNRADPPEAIASDIGEVRRHRRGTYWEMTVYVRIPSSIPIHHNLNSDQVQLAVHDENGDILPTIGHVDRIDKNTMNILIDDPGFYKIIAIALDKFKEPN